MNLIQKILYNNDCYKEGRTINVEGLMLHSTGANNPYVRRYVSDNGEILGVNEYNNDWNRSGLDVCVHGFIGYDKDENIITVQTLPWNHRAWHCGSYANNTHISVEICEDGLDDSTYFNKVYKEAVELFAYLCKQFNLSSNDIICHCEGYKLGIASNHSDVMHWFPMHGKSMDTFRADVQTLLNGSEPQPVPTPTTEKIAIIQELLNIRYNTGLEVDNLYGPCTHRGFVIGLQTEFNVQLGAGLDVDGIFGPLTKSACPNVEIGDEGNISWLIQAMLICKGYDLELDGIFGAETERVVKQFQADNNLEIDGIVGENTFEKLFA